MKKLFTIAALTLFSVAAYGQLGPNAITLGTNRVANASTNTAEGSAFFIGGRNAMTVAASGYSTNAAIGAGDVGKTFTLRLSGSFDGTTYYVDGTNLDVVVTLATTNVNSVATRLETTKWQYLKPTSLLNASTGLVVFPSAVYFTK